MAPCEDEGCRNVPLPILNTFPVGILGVGILVTAPAHVGHRCVMIDRDCRQTGHGPSTRRAEGGHRRVQEAWTQVGRRQLAAWPLGLIKARRQGPEQTFESHGCRPRRPFLHGRDDSPCGQCTPHAGQDLSHVGAAAASSQPPWPADSIPPSIHSRDRGQN